MHDKAAEPLSVPGNSMKVRIAAGSLSLHHRRATTQLFFHPEIFLTWNSIIFLMVYQE